MGKLHNTYNLLSKLTLNRLINTGKVYYSYRRSRFTGKPRHGGWPVSIAIEPTTSCNLRCPECPSGLRAFTRPTGMLDPAFYRRTIDELKEHLLYLTFYFQGEPFLHPQLCEMIRYAADRKIYTSTSTNAHFLDDETAKKVVESGLDKLIVSVDGVSQETYVQYRIGGKLEKVLEGAANVIRWKRELRSKTPHVVFQFLVVRHNEHETSAIRELAEKMQADEVVFKTAQVYDYVEGNKLIPNDDRYSRYRKNKNGSWEIKNKLLDHCWKMWHSCVITWDGKIVPCCFDKDASHQVGNLNENKFADIWNGAGYDNFRQAILNGRDQIDICKNCSEGTHS